jgi:hypothetical protein
MTTLNAQNAEPAHERQISLAKRVRIDQTVRGLEQLDAEIKAWACKRHKADRVQQYFTQLNALTGVLENALTRLKPEVDALTTAAGITSVAKVYDQCRTYEKRIIWIRRLWRYFQDKFDQRDTSFADTIFAADEIVWSCYSETFTRAKLDARGTVPLIYIEPQYSPNAVPRLEPPPDLKHDVDGEFVATCLAQLPVPLIGLPTVCLSEPWWLAFLAHEIGHHVQYDIVPGADLVATFGTLLAAAATGWDNVAEASLRPEATRWNTWGREVFADAFSVLQLGEGAVWAMTELETTSNLSMLKGKILYPAPAVRLALLAALADRLGLDARNALRWVDPRGLTTDAQEGHDKLRAEAAAELDRLPFIVEAVLERPLPPLPPLPMLCAWDTENFVRQTKYWSTELLKPRLPEAERDVRAARYILSGAVRAWHQVSVIEDDAMRNDQQQTLKSNLLPTLRNSREEGTRSGDNPAAVNVEALGAKLTDLLSRIPE